MDNLVKPPQPVRKKSKLKIFLSILISFLSVVIILITITGTLGFFFVYVPGKKLYQQVNLLKTDLAEIKAAATDKDINRLKTDLENSKKKIAAIEESFHKFSFAQSIPYTKPYYQDGLEGFKIIKNGFETADIILNVIEPYRDFLGLKGASTDSSKTTEDRIAFLTKTVEGLVPHMDTIEKKITEIEDSLNKIDPNRYPEEYQGYKIRPQLLKAREILAEAKKFLRDGRPILTKTSWLLGKDKPRTYLLIFQNDAELRPTGGFWTAYGLIKVDKGKPTTLSSDDIYALDAKFNSTIPAPRPIKAYHINVPYWNIRDMNISPDFPTSIELFLQYYNKYSGNKDKIDAVVGIDTQVLVELVKVLGRVGVTGFGNFYADPDKRCDGCPQIIYQLEWFAGRPRNYIEKDRKGFLSPLMQSIMANSMGTEKNKLGPLVQGAVNSILQKHVLFYFSDPEMQKAAVLANIAGTITQTDEKTDYFHLNDANMSSAKTNMFLKQKIKHEIIVKNGKVEHKVSVTYTNPSRASNCNLEKGDLCLNAPKYRDWFRFFVPTGSQLVKMTGSEVSVDPYEELGKQVFEGFYGDKYPLYAQSNLKTSVQYVSSVPASPNYTLLLQKQPGTKPVDYELWVNGQKYETFVWNGDKTIKLSL